MERPYALGMADRDEHAAYEWAEYNVPLEIRALPPQPTPLARRILAGKSLAAARLAVEERRAADPFWSWMRRPA
jgi:hypothetical protein